MKTSVKLRALLLPFLAAFGFVAGCGGGSGGGSAASANVPADIKAIFNKPVYKHSQWGLRVIDLGTGRTLINLRPDRQFLIGSVRKIFSVGELLNQIGPNYSYDTPVYEQGTISSGVLDGNLILVASGDLTMGGRTNPDGTIALSNFDHNEADSLGNAVLTAPDPLAGYTALANQVAAAGINEISGEVIIDDRLFTPFNFRDQFNVTPIFVNDDAVDLTINPTSAGNPASVVSRPVSAALGVTNSLLTSAAGTKSTLELDPQFPACIGTPGCTATITGELPIDFVPALTDSFPLVQTFRIVAPSNYARTVFIEALEAAGVTVDAAPVEANPVQLLPPKNSYPADTKVALLTGMPYSDDAKFVLKVSYNIGADTSLVLWGLTQGVDNLADALGVEQPNLSSNYGIAPSEYHFVDGSGGGDTTASNRAVTHMLIDLAGSPVFAEFFDALPILAVDGSLAFVTDFQSDPTLAGAAGQVRAKPGTYAMGSSSGIILKGQEFAGYVTAKSGRQLVFAVVVNNVPLAEVNDILPVFQDEGTIAATLWRDN
jgi:D-alanyl-D-alanine carboxypeptidase